MFFAPVLAVIRASGFGVSFSAATLLIGSCSILPNETDAVRIQRVEEAVLPMARIALEAEQTETARRLYLRLLEVDPNSVGARMGLGEIAVARRDSAEAARWYAAAVSQATQAEERHAALLAHGRATLAGGDLAAARKSFSRLTSSKENAPAATAAWGLNGLGLVTLLEGDIRVAISFMEQAVLLVPEEKMLADNLSRALDMSAGIVPESARADEMDNMATAPSPAPSPDEQPPAFTDDATAVAVEKDVLEVGPAVESLRRDPGAGRGVGTREERVEEDGAPVGEPVGEPVGKPDDGRIDKSDLRPYAIEVGGQYFVRIGAYAIEAAAQDFASELRRITTESVDVSEFGMGDGSDAVKLYRVVIGPIESRAGLTELVETLEGMGYGAARVPAADASEAEPAADLELAPSAEQTQAGPELVEVFLEPLGIEADVTQTVAQQSQTIPEPGPGAQRPVAASGGAEVAPFDEGIDPGEMATDASLSPNGGDGTDDLDAPQFLQVGAYTVRSTAEALASEVGSVARAPVRIVEAELANGETMYRVQVGPIRSRRMMTELSGMLMSGGYGTVRVLPESAVMDSGIGGVEEVPSAEPLGSGSSERRVKAFIVHEGARRFLQMGAYAVRSTADTLAAQLRLITSEPVVVGEALADDAGPLHRVRIGPIESDASLETLLDALRSSYGTGWALPSTETDAARTAFLVHENTERYLQMGAYAVRSAADELAAELRGEIEAEVRITEVSPNGGNPIYRVRIGPIASDDSLLKLVEAVESLGFVVD